MIGGHALRTQFLLVAFLSAVGAWMRFLVHGHSRTQMESPAPVSMGGLDAEGAGFSSIFEEREGREMPMSELVNQ